MTENSHRINHSLLQDFPTLVYRLDRCGTYQPLTDLQTTNYLGIDFELLSGELLPNQVPYKPPTERTNDLGPFDHIAPIPSTRRKDSWLRAIRPVLNGHVVPDTNGNPYKLVDESDYFHLAKFLITPVPCSNDTIFFRAVTHGCFLIDFVRHQLDNLKAAAPVPENVAASDEDSPTFSVENPPIGGYSRWEKFNRTYMRQSVPTFVNGLVPMIVHSILHGSEPSARSDSHAFWKKSLVVNYGDPRNERQYEDRGYKCLGLWHYLITPLLLHAESRLTKYGFCMCKALEEQGSHNCVETLYKKQCTVFSAEYILDFLSKNDPDSDFLKGKLFGFSRTCELLQRYINRARKTKKSKKRHKKKKQKEEEQTEEVRYDLDRKQTEDCSNNIIRDGRYMLVPIYSSKDTAATLVAAFGNCDGNLQRHGTPTYGKSDETSQKRDEVPGASPSPLTTPEGPRRGGGNCGRSPSPTRAVHNINGQTSPRVHRSSRGSSSHSHDSSRYSSDSLADGDKDRRRTGRRAISRKRFSSNDSYRSHSSSDKDKLRKRDGRSRKRHGSRKRRGGSRRHSRSRNSQSPPKDSNVTSRKRRYRSDNSSDEVSGRRRHGRSGRRRVSRSYSSDSSSDEVAGRRRYGRSGRRRENRRHRGGSRDGDSCERRGRDGRGRSHHSENLTAEDEARKTRYENRKAPPNYSTANNSSTPLSTGICSASAGHTDSRLKAPPSYSTADNSSTPRTTDIRSASAAHAAGRPEPPPNYSTSNNSSHHVGVEQSQYVRNADNCQSTSSNRDDRKVPARPKYKKYSSDEESDDRKLPAEPKYKKYSSDEESVGLNPRGRR